MIPVQMQPEPPHFDSLVRKPGLQAMNQRTVSTQHYRFPALWKKIKKELHSAYGGICAYTCIYLVGTGSVDHFLPKRANPRMAYEWSNYRLARERTNSRKGEHTGILDPFKIGTQWFELVFPACLVVPGCRLPTQRTPAALRTIEILKLNEDDELVQDRCDIILSLRDGIVQLGFLEQRYPFIADELKRQNLLDNLASVFRHPST